jgi:hypothetical protein
MHKASLFDVEPLNGVKICASAKVLTILHQELQIVKSKIKIQGKEYDVIDDLGKYPVIMANFKDLGGSSYEELVEDLKVNLRKKKHLGNIHTY